MFGAGDGGRTHDLNVGNVSLYHWATPASNFGGLVANRTPCLERTWFTVRRKNHLALLNQPKLKANPHFSCILTSRTISAWLTIAYAPTAFYLPGTNFFIHNLIPRITTLPKYSKEHNYCFIILKMHNCTNSLNCLSPGEHSSILDTNELGLLPLSKAESIYSNQSITQPLFLKLSKIVVIGTP